MISFRSCLYYPDPTTEQLNAYENFQMVMTNHIICSNTLMIRSSVIKLKQMIEEDNNNNEDYSTEAIHNKSKRTLQNKELLKVLEALESLGFRSSNYHES